jgi:hypothetical protein
MMIKAGGQRLPQIINGPKWGKHREAIMSVRWIKTKCCYYCKYWVEPNPVDMGKRPECVADQEDDPEPVMTCDKFEPNLLYEQISTA